MGAYRNILAEALPENVESRGGEDVGAELTRFAYHDSRYIGEDVGIDPTKIFVADMTGQYGYSDGKAVIFEDPAFLVTNISGQKSGAALFFSFGPTVRDGKVGLLSVNLVNLPSGTPFCFICTKDKDTVAGDSPAKTLTNFATFPLEQTGSAAYMANLCWMQAKMTE